jgi:putative glutamine amidotransferase
VSRLPTIGITTALEDARYLDRRARVALVPAGYPTALARAGGRPLGIFTTQSADQDPDALLDLLDALLITGGAGDVDPDAYGERRHPATRPSTPERDALEIALARAALARDMPVLGICRGMQILNVAAGGTIDQHLADSLGHDGHRGPGGSFVDHEVRVTPQSLCARVLGDVGWERVRSLHHQGPAQLGAGFVATAWGVPDDNVEAIEDPVRRFALGVLWHPEEDPHSRVLAALVAAARGEPAGVGGTPPGGIAASSGRR